MGDQTSGQDMVTDTADLQTENQAQAQKTYTQEEFDRHMAGLKSSIQKKYDKVFADLGDIEELKSLKQQSEAKKLEDAKKRGEFEKVIQELAAKKDAEIAKRDEVIREYKVNTPLLSAAAKYRAVAPEQVKSLLANRVRMNAEGEVEVVGDDGGVRYRDDGQAYQVEDLVREFLDSNTHFVSATPATTNTKSNVTVNNGGKIDISKLDMTKPEHRKLYAEYRKTSGIFR
jgi:hypothetical protein